MAGAVSIKAVDKGIWARDFDVEKSPFATESTLINM